MYEERIEKQMKKVLICGPFGEAERKKFREAVHSAELLFLDQEKITSRTVKMVQAVIGNIPVELLKACPDLEWVQLISSGADAYAVPGILSGDTVLTSATGAYGPGIAEYMVAMLLMMMKKIPYYLENQKQGLWRDEGHVTGLYGKRVLIVGTGDIGLEFAARIRPFGCEIAGIRRRPGVCPKELDALYTMDALEAELGKADVTALCLPGTAQTYQLFGEHLLDCCRPGSYLMNVGRGNVIDTQALTHQALRGKFAGIWLDVCDPEPLPYGHPLYSAPGVVLTPHIAGGFHLDATREKILEICLHNLKAWQGNGEYRSVVDLQTGYCK